MRYRLSLDVGTNSIGWCVLRLDDTLKPEGIEAIGSRIFPDGRDAKTKASLAEDRRIARSARRRRDRYLKRRTELLQLLKENGLMPSEQSACKALELQNPYALRARGLDEPLELHEFGRVLFHLNQRRGFKSNRRTDSGEDAGPIKEGIARLKAQLQEANARTYGEYLFALAQKGQPVRIRREDDSPKTQYPFYPERTLLQEEFQALWEKQRCHYPSLTDDLRQTLEDAIFYQRPLRPVQPGRCTFNPGEDRAPRALPTAQRFRMLQETNNIRIVSPTLEKRPLTLKERDAVLQTLLGAKKRTFEQIRKTLGLSAEDKITLESAKRTALSGDDTGFSLAKKECFGKSWWTLPLQEQDEIVSLLLTEEDESVLHDILTTRWALTDAQATQVGALSFLKGFAQLGMTALCAITAELEKDVIPYSEAVARAKLGSHSDFRDGVIWERLPYYGEILRRHIAKGTGKHTDRQEQRLGRIANPTVHIALNQIRRVVNELIKTLGHPTQVVVEVARELKEGEEGRRERERTQAEHQKANEGRKARLREMGIAVTGDALLRMRLWEELHPDAASRRCVYTGEPISMERLFSSEVEIEHILPFSASLDDSPANKTLSLRAANRYKAERSPAQAFAASPPGYDWQGILGRAAFLPDNKTWRFAEGAMERFDAEGGFLERQLKDTQYIATVAREYMTAICDHRQVWVTPGRLTNLLGRHWGLPKKNRDDHRHHAFDAVLIGVADRRILQLVGQTHARERLAGVERFLSTLPEPWPGFRDETIQACRGIIVSHKSDNRPGGRLHNATAYGLYKENSGIQIAQHKVPVSSLTTIADIRKIKGIGIASRFLALAGNLSPQECVEAILHIRGMKEKEAIEHLNSLVDCDDKTFKQRLQDYARKKGIRRVRILEPLTLIPINDKAGHPYKWFKGDSNAYYEIFAGQDGQWTGRIVSTFQACQSQDTAEQPSGDLVARLSNRDMLELEHEGIRKIVYVVKLSEKQLAFAEHFEANTDARNRDKDDAFRFIYKGSPDALRKAKARPIFITPAGKVIYKELPSHDPENGGGQR
ncbi:type II CRISPR RNA-guided endonuclease Cas9 [Desulfocurvus vexinensis]|uniref:type II CRISPR RNA-guided endonuclease Cas9 n=1 Tax=Desulfocurvus vexinensis TaxID=399548 RepID=UPI000A06A2E5|nr:type II CRISPR RNA-guided endonuclease Cas9 [Desulfocurvus vexinensis]